MGVLSIEIRAKGGQMQLLCLCWNSLPPISEEALELWAGLISRPCCFLNSAGGHPVIIQFALFCSCYRNYMLKEKEMCCRMFGPLNSPSAGENLKVTGSEPLLFLSFILVLSSLLVLSEDCSRSMYEQQGI